MVQTENLIDHEHADKAFLRFSQTKIEGTFNLSFYVGRIKRKICQVT